jgi:hypothetical protein
VNTKRVNAAADVIHRAMQQGKTLPVSLAAALEATCMLQSPETAAEARQLQNDVTGACLARWEEEQENARLRLAWKSARERAEAYGQAIQRHVADRDTWKGWVKAAETEVAALRARVAELADYERLSPQQCPKGLHADWLVDSEYAHACPWCRVAELEAAAVCPSVARLYGSTCVLPVRHRGDHRDETKRHYWSDEYAAPAQPRQAEDPHTSELHHDYALGRDDLAIPRQVTGRCPNGHTFEDCTCGGAA